MYVYIIRDTYVYIGQSSASWVALSIRFLIYGFSIAADIRSLSFILLVTSADSTCASGSTKTSILQIVSSGKLFSSLARIYKPILVACEQTRVVGLNVTHICVYVSQFCVRQIWVSKHAIARVCIVGTQGRVQSELYHIYLLQIQRVTPCQQVVHNKLRQWGSLTDLCECMCECICGCVYVCMCAHMCVYVLISVNVRVYHQIKNLYMYICSCEIDLSTNVSMAMCV